jgi:hypothetical protein
MHEYLAATVSTPNMNPDVWVWVLVGIIIGIWFGRRIR